MTVSEVSKLWGISLDDIKYLGEEGLLEICIHKIPLKVAMENILAKKPYSPNKQKQEDIINFVKTPQPLHPTDIYLLFSNRDKKLKLSRLKTEPILKITKVETPGVEIGFDDMVITISERKRFEFEHLNKTVKYDDSEVLILKSPDFSSIELYGERYNFGAKQAKVVKHLYDQYYLGDPWSHGKALLRAANSECYRLSNLFNKHKAWRKVIISNKRGFYRINLPYNQPAPCKAPDLSSPSFFD